MSCLDPRFIASLAVLLCAGCQGPSSTEPNPSQLSSTERIALSDVHTLDGVFTAGQPSPDVLEQIQQGGFKSVLNLRHADEIYFDERAAVEDLGMSYIHIPFGGSDELTDEVLDEALQALDTLPRPILFHCGSASRVGAVWFAWRVRSAGIEEDSALIEARTVGLRSEGLEQRVRDYLAQ